MRASLIVGMAFPSRAKAILIVTMSNPFLQAREIRKRYGATLAQASDDQNMGSLLPTYSPSQLAANGITPTTTVGQWRQSIIAKIGNAANQPVLSG